MIIMQSLHAQDTLSMVHYGKDNRLLDICRLGQPVTCPLYDNEYLFLTCTTNLLIRDNNYRGRRSQDHVENIWFYISMERKQFSLILLGYPLTGTQKKEADWKECAVYALRKYVRCGRRKSTVCSIKDKLNSSRFRVHTASRLEWCRHHPPF